LCSFWEVSRQAFYKNRKLAICKQEERDLILRAVREVRSKHPRLGTLKLRHLLKDDIKKCGPGYGKNKFFDLLRANDMLLKRRRRYTVTTDSDHAFKKHTYHLVNTEITAPDQAWVTDITYLATRRKFVYLSLVTDVYSRKIVGWNVDESLAVEGAMAALKMAIKNSSATKGLIHHSDRGIQYCCHAYNNVTKEKEMIMSMGEAGNCYDNAIAERVNGILKDEYLLDSEFINKTHAIRAVKEAVYLYNYERPHWTLNLKKPAEVYFAEKRTLKKREKGSIKDAGAAPFTEQETASFIL
jgi:transposase InsO family protein